MAPKVTVPLDFGIENLHCEFHGNVVLKLQGGEEKRANSLILSYHSSVFVHLFLELHQTELEVEDFAGEAVKKFLAALYSGEILLEKDLFRDVNKLCHVFKVEWLAGRCGDYVTSLVGPPFVWFRAKDQAASAKSGLWGLGVLAGGSRCGSC